MGYKRRGSELHDVFDDYRSWYAQSESPKRDDRNRTDPLASLAPLSAREYRQLEEMHGALPASYRELVCNVGVGPVLIGGRGEPAEFTILPPKHILCCRRDCLSWIDEDLLAAAKTRQGIDSERLMPFLVDRDWNQWALLANQRKRDDRALLFSHEQEQPADGDLFKQLGTVTEYFRALFDQAKKGSSPWYLWSGWK